MTPHSALADAGFRLAEESTHSGRIGPVTTRRYVKNTGVVGEGTPVRPITHAVTVREYGRSPGKLDVDYEVTQLGGPYASGYYNAARRHEKNAPGGVADPIREILNHHDRVVQDLKQRGGPEQVDVGPNNLHRLSPDLPYHWSPGWGLGEDPHMKRRVFLRPGGDPRLPLHTNSGYTASGPVSDEDWQSFVSGRNPVYGMMPDGTPVVDHFDPDYGRLEEPDSRGARQRTYLSHAVQRGASGEPEIYEFRGRCVTCRTPTWNTQDGGEVPDWHHTGNAHYAKEYDMHGPDIPQCADCANDYERYNNAIRIGQKPGGRWHYPGAKPNTCDDCYHSIMDEADEDLT